MRRKVLIWFFLILALACLLLGVAAPNTTDPIWTHDRADGGALHLVVFKWHVEFRWLLPGCGTSSWRKGFEIPSVLAFVVFDYAKDPVINLRFGQRRGWIVQFSLPVLAAMLLIYPITAFLWGRYRRLRTSTNTTCHKCGYDLTGNTSGICPECGMAIRTEAPSGPVPADKPGAEA